MMISRLAVALILLLHAPGFRVRQTRSIIPEAESWEVGPAQCQLITAVLDVLVQKMPPDERISVVARFGAGEIRPELNSRRLHNVRVYWTQYLKGVKRRPETIILTEGEKVEGDGRLEFYVGGKLKGVLKVRRDADLYVGTCYPPDDSYIRNRVYDHCWVKEDRYFYPCLDRGRPRNAERRVRGSSQRAS
jgi:hypothetical protein